MGLLRQHQVRCLLVTRHASRFQRQFLIRCSAADAQPVCLFKTESEYNKNIMVLEFPEEFPLPEVAGARALLLDHTGNLQSIYKADVPMTGGLYWDYLAAVGALVPPGPPLAILGLGGGTVAHVLHHLYPQRDMVAWEIDMGVIMTSQQLLGLSTLEATGRLSVCIGDALSPSVAELGPYAGIIVDLFAEGKLLPQLCEKSTWGMLKDMLCPGGRIIVNVGFTQLPNADQALQQTGVVDFAAGRRALAALADVFQGEVLVCQDSVSRNTCNTLAMTGPMLADMTSALPADLQQVPMDWKEYDAADYPLEEQKDAVPSSEKTPVMFFQDQDD